MKNKTVIIVNTFLAVFLVASNLQSASADSAVTQDRYIVRFADDVDSKLEESQYKAKGLNIEKSFSGAFKGFIGNFSTNQISDLKKNNKVLYIEKDGPVHTTNFFTTPVSVANVPSWGLDRINQRLLPLDSTFSYQYNGAGVTAYVIDTGINSTHSEFTGRVATGNSQIVDGRGTTDCNGHGTHVAGTIGGSTFGVARAVTLVPVRVLDCLGSGTFSGVIAGIDWVIANHLAGQPAVANLSLGGGYSLAVNDAIARLVADGVVVSVAAGNSNANACNYSPSSAPNAITVGATEKTDLRASYSNFGTCLDVFAPGSLITSSWIGSNTATSTISGTSMASPHVAGVAALMLEKNPNATPLQIRNDLVAFATPNVVNSPGTGSPNILLATDTAGAYVAPVVTVPSTPIVNSLASNSARTLTLQASTASNGGSAIKSYSIKLWLSSTAAGTLSLNKTFTLTTSANSFTTNITGLTRGSFYAVSVIATNAVGSSIESALSSRVQVK